MEHLYRFLEAFFFKAQLKFLNIFLHACVLKYFSFGSQSQHKEIIVS